MWQEVGPTGVSGGGQCGTTGQAGLVWPWVVGGAGLPAGPGRGLTAGSTAPGVMISLDKVGRQGRPGW